MAHFDAYLRYSDVLILSSAVPAGRGVYGGGCSAPPRKFLGPQHYIDNQKITLLVLLWCNCDVSFSVLGYRYLNGANISWAIELIV